MGCNAGFHSEVDAMMQCMLYCYCNQIKFILYADDANWANGNGWEEFFLPFCEMNHNPLNHYGNMRRNKKRYQILSRMLKIREQVQYLTSDIFKICIPRSYSTKDWVVWKEFGIEGCSLQEFGKLGKMVLKYNDKTEKEVKSFIDKVNLPSQYVSIQFRSGDKILEYDHLLESDKAIKRIQESGVEFTNIFVFIIIINLLFTCLIYTYSLLHGFKGISVLANICIYLFFGLIAFVLIIGRETRYIIETGFSSLGKMVQNFVELATYSDPLRNTNFPQT